MNDKDLRNFLKKNNSSNLERPPGEWSQIQSRIKKKNRSLIIPSFATAAALVLIIFSFNLVEVGDKNEELNAFISESYSYLELGPEEENELYF